MSSKLKRLQAIQKYLKYTILGVKDYTYIYTTPSRFLYGVKVKSFSRV